ncbi:MAG: DUF1653 domain-containing protein [Patescibacteria group bacterium]
METKLIYPENGFYYHYKHDLSKGINDHAYEVMGIGHNTEIDDLEESAMVMYRPIYNQVVYQAGKHWDLRPVSMFIDKDFEKDGKIIPERFKKITDEKIIAELSKIRDEMY